MITREELDALTDEQLIELEDHVLTENEKSGRYRIRASSGRIVIFVLSGLYWLILMGFVATISLKIPEATRPLFTFPAFFVTFGIAIFLATRTWTASGVRARYIVRTAFHYWPVTLTLGAIIVSLLK